MTPEVEQTARQAVEQRLRLRQLFLAEKEETEHIDRQLHQQRDPEPGL